MSALVPLLQSQNQNWETPSWLVSRVWDLAPIALDPCSTDLNPVGARWWMTPRYSGLVHAWHPHVPCGEISYINSPYGRALPTWMGRCIEQHRLGVDQVVLTPARTDTRWFNRMWQVAHSVCLLRGRLTFQGAVHPAPFPSALWLLSQDAELGQRFWGLFDDAGILVRCS